LADEIRRAGFSLPGVLAEEGLADVLPTPMPKTDTTVI
jgi:hypothetical protein